MNKHLQNATLFHSRYRTKGFKENSTWWLRVHW